MPSTLTFFLTLLVSLLGTVFPALAKSVAPYGPNGKWQEPGGLVNDGFRHRDQRTATFLSRDPAGFIDGPNTYNYVRHNPWSAFDPHGLSSTIPITTGEVGYVGEPSVIWNNPPGTTGGEDYPVITTDPDAGLPPVLSGADASPGVTPSLPEILPYLGEMEAWIEEFAVPPTPYTPSPHDFSLAMLGLNSADLMAEAESGKYSPEDTKRLIEESISRSNSEHDWSIIVKSAEGLLLIASTLEPTPIGESLMTARGGATVVSGLGSKSRTIRRTFSSSDEAYEGGAKLTLSEAEVIASEHGIDMRIFKLEHDPNNAYDFGSVGRYFNPKTMSDGPIVRAPDGRIILRLYDKGLRSSEDLVETVSHELNHVRGYLKNGEFTSETAAEKAAEKARPYIRKKGKK